MNRANTLTIVYERECLCPLLVIIVLCFFGCTKPHEPGYTTVGTDGVYRCCLPGEGTSCCKGTATGTCFQYGGISGTCTTEGDSFEAKDICSGCCEGLVRVPDCDGPPSVLRCTRCGDGSCGPGEDSCNCAADCGSTTNSAGSSARSAR
jgi:hypothetical protein